MRTHKNLIIALSLLLVILVSCTGTELSDLRNLETRVAVPETAMSEPTSTPAPAAPERVAPPEHMASIWWYWPEDSHEFQRLQWDFTIHNDPGDFSDDQGLYLMIAYGSSPGSISISGYRPTFGVRPEDAAKG